MDLAVTLLVDGLLLTAVGASPVAISTVDVSILVSGPKQDGKFTSGTLTVSVMGSRTDEIKVGVSLASKPGDSCRFTTEGSMSRVSWMEHQVDVEFLCGRPAGWNGGEGLGRPWEVDSWSTWWMAIAPRAQGDYSGDGFVDGADLAWVVGHWGQADCTGVVDAQDLTLVLANWKQ